LFCQSYINDKKIKSIKKKKKKILTAVTDVKLNNKGMSKVNSKSYNTKKTHSKVKLKLNCMSVSVETLKPHS
jgi:hypothetical protein